MKSIFTLAFLVLTFYSTAQNVSFTVFSNEGQQFFIIMNGIKQNSIPQTNVKVSGMTTGSYAMKVIFADGKTPDISKNMFIDVAGDHTARIITKKGVNKLQYFGVTNEGGQTPPPSSTIVYRPNEQTVYSDQVAVSMNFGGTQTTTTSTTTQSTGVGVGTSTNLSDPVTGEQINMNVNININDAMMNGTTTGTTTTTTTSTTTSSEQTTNYGSTGQVVQNGGSYNLVNQGNTNYNCSKILVEADDFWDEYNEQSFDTDKRKLIEKRLATHCLTADQAYRLVSSLSFDSDKIIIAEFLFVRMTDKINGKRLVELFSFDSDKKRYRDFMAAY